MDKKEQLNLLKKALSDVVIFLEGADPSIKEMSKHFRSGKELEANKELEQVLESLQWITDLIGDIGKILNIDFTTYKFKDSTVSKKYEDLLKATKEMLEAQSNTDWIMLADLIEYELAPFLEDLCDIFKDISSNYLSDVQE